MRIEPHPLHDRICASNVPISEVTYESVFFLVTEQPQEDCTGAMTLVQSICFVCQIAQHSTAVVFNLGYAYLRGYVKTY
jgi:hypothetical protein